MGAYASVNAIVLYVTYNCSIVKSVVWWETVIFQKNQFTRQCTLWDFTSRPLCRHANRTPFSQNYNVAAARRYGTVRCALINVATDVVRLQHFSAGFSNRHMHVSKSYSIYLDMSYRTSAGDPQRGLQGSTIQSGDKSCGVSQLHICEDKLIKKKKGLFVIFEYIYVNPV